MTKKEFIVFELVADSLILKWATNYFVELNEKEINLILASAVLYYDKPEKPAMQKVEKFIKEHSGEFKKRKLWENLPRKMMYQTYCTTIDYLLESGKIAMDKERKIAWIYNPKLFNKYINRKDLGR